MRKIFTKWLIYYMRAQKHFIGIIFSQMEKFHVFVSHKYNFILTCPRQEDLFFMIFVSPQALGGFIKHQNV